MDKSSRLIFSPRRSFNCFYWKKYDALCRSKFTLASQNGKLNTSCPYSAENNNEIYKSWEVEGFFKPKQNDSNTSFSMILPPPNITGKLHLGHALTSVIQDSLIRWKRMKGVETLWIPGSDHAGIATQSVVERHVQLCKGKTARQLGREEFAKELWNWRQDRGDDIFNQLRQLGCSLDWDRTCFTMSDHHSHAVREAFIRLFDLGLIYKRNYIINWSCQLRSVISDIEVDRLEVSKKTNLPVFGSKDRVPFGVLYDVIYKMEKGDGELIVSTTRPETIIGDIALAVHPDDTRYSNLIGSNVIHPLSPHKLLPIIGDAGLVDPKFGSGVVKVTPSVDKSDFECALRNELIELEKCENLFSEMGNLIAKDCPTFDGMNRWEARNRIITHLKSLNCLKKVDTNYPMEIPICSRTTDSEKYDVIEYRLESQYFMDVKDMFKNCLEAVQNGEVKLIPEYNNATWKNWLNETRSNDWCLSRQLWWGHRIPVFKFSAKNDDDGLSQDRLVAAHSEEEAWEKFKAETNVVDNSELANLYTCRGEEDVLDTWFSSSIIPFANLGWPNYPSNDYEKYYPISLMETGGDILFFWVARMVGVGQILTGKLPFNRVLLHGMVCDSKGRKMSKSVGNVIDPLHLITGVPTFDEIKSRIEKSTEEGEMSKQECKLALKEMKSLFPNGIPAYGVDAVRYALYACDVKAVQLNLDVRIIELGRLFCNKLWNLVRFVIEAVDRCPHQFVPIHSDLNHTLLNNSSSALSNVWLMSRCARCVMDVESNLENFNSHFVIQAIRKFVYNEMCDVYVEAIKSTLWQSDNPNFTPSLSSLVFSVVTSLKLIHPVMPFVTEQLYQDLRTKFPNLLSSDSIMIDNFPLVEDWTSHLNVEVDALFSDILMPVVSSVRKSKLQYRLTAKSISSQIDVHIVIDEEMHMKLMKLCGITPICELVRLLVKCRNVSIEIAEDFDAKEHSFLSDTIDVDVSTNLNTKSASEIHVYCDILKLVDWEAEHLSVCSKIRRLNKKIGSIISRNDDKMMQLIQKEMDQLERHKKLALKQLKCVVT